MSDVSPVHSYCCHGTWISDEPHSIEWRNPPRNTVYSGAMSGTIPSASCESARSMHVFANIASAFQPQRIWSAWMWSCSCQPSFSRCGQSVNTLCMLERCAHQQMS